MGNVSTNLHFPTRFLPYEAAPALCRDSGLWLYGNVKLLETKLTCITESFGPPIHSTEDLDHFEREAEVHVLSGRTLVTGIHNAAHQRVAIVPLRWGAPRVIVLSGGFYHHLGPNLKSELFRAARLWRAEFDARTDLVLSRRAPAKASTFAQHHPTVDRLIDRIVKRQVDGILFRGR